VAWATNAITEGRSRFRIGTQWFSRSGCWNRRAPARPCGRGKLAQFSLLQRFAVWWVAPPWPILSVAAVLLALCRLVEFFRSHCSDHTSEPGCTPAWRGSKRHPGQRRVRNRFIAEPGRPRPGSGRSGRGPTAVEDCPGRFADLPAPMAKWAGFALCWVMLFGLERPGEPRRLRKSNPEQGEACREVA